MSDWTLSLSPDLALELINKMHGLVESYRAFSPDDSTPGTEQVRVHTHVIPTHTD